MYKFVSLLLFLQAVLSCPTIEETSNPGDSLRFRLPRNVRPINYAITLQPDFDLARFDGEVQIRLTPIENTRNITLKIRQLSIDINGTSLWDGDEELEIDSIIQDAPNEFFIINTVDELLVGNEYLLDIASYEGILHLDNGGFYLAKYMEDGVEKRFGTTQFQSTNARRAFPSFDEPEWKATFNISMIRPADYHSISNGQLISSSSVGPGLVRDDFAESVIMSSYLVAFVVSQYEHVEKENQRVFARPQAVRDGWCEYGLDIGIQTIAALEDFLGVEYTLDKMDQVAIPDVHFSPGAMENWGLVTYKESYLLYSEKHSTTQQLQKIATVIAHEFGHQWFGNLVTCQWWRYTWLNEGFATYFELYAASVVEPTWRLMEQFTFDIHDALEFDSTNVTTPMNYESASGSGAPTLITYDKAGSVIRMAEHFLTSPVFRSALNIYLNNRKFDVAVPQDLFDGFQSAVDQAGTSDLLGGYSVADILGPWTDQEGYPLVTVTRDYLTGDVHLAQRRFLRENYTDQNTNLLWPIPLNFMFSTRDNFDFSTTTAEYWFTQQEDSLLNFPTGGIVIANKQQSGFYRVNYDLQNWYGIIDHLRSGNHEDIVPMNRAQLIDDAFNLAKAGVLDYNVALDLSRYILRETDYIPINSFVLEVEYLRTKVTFTDTLELFAAYILNQLSVVADQLTFNDNVNDDHTTRLNRVAVFKTLCNLGEASCLTNSLEALRQWQQDDNYPLTPNMQQYAFCAALRVGTADDFWNLYDRYTTEEVEFLRTRILTALGCAGDASVLNSYLDKILDSSSLILDTDRQNAFAAVYNSGNFGLRVAFEYLKDNFDRINQSSLNINTIITGIGSKFNTEEQQEELRELAELHGYNYFGPVLWTVKDNLEWNNKFLPVIHTWLITDN